MNDDTQGYHETITQVYIAAVRAHLNETEADLSLKETVNALLLSRRGRRDLPLKHYSRDLIFSLLARSGFVERRPRQPIQNLVEQSGRDATKPYIAMRWYEIKQMALR